MKPLDCLRLLKYADAKTGKWFRDYRNLCVANYRFPQESAIRDTHLAEVLLKSISIVLGVNNYVSLLAAQVNVRAHHRKWAYVGVDGATASGVTDELGAGSAERLSSL